MAIDPTTLFPGAAGDREGAILEIRPENLWQDAAGTTPVTTDGDPVRRIVDTSVNGRDFVAYEDAFPLTYHTDGTAHWLTSPATNDFGFQSADTWGFMSGNPYSVGAAVSFGNPGGGDQYFFCTMPTGSGAVNDSVVHCGARSGSTATIAHWFNDQDFSHSFPTDTPERYICEYKNPGSEYTVDGSQIDVSATTPSALDQVNYATIFIREPISVSEAPMEGKLFGMIIIIDTITAQERSDIDGWLQEQIEGPSEQTIAVGQAAETDAATSMVLATTTVTGQAAESDTATAVGGAKVRTTGLSSESSTATAVGRDRALATAQATEAATANAVVLSRTELALQATEENNAWGVTISRAWMVGQAGETSSATGVAASGALNVGLSAETDAAQPVGHFRVAGVGQGTESAVAQPVAHVRATLVGQAGESSAATSLGHSRLAVVGLATEGDTAGGVTGTGGAEPEPGEGDFWIIRRRRRWV